MYVLGIETSCDETAASIVRDGRAILSNVITSSLDFHKKYGGVVPEIASRMQLETITEVVDNAIKVAGIGLEDISLISVTSGPGLLGSLLVGMSFAKAASISLGIPFLGINHLHSHIYASFLNGVPVKLPFVALVVSGGHTSLFYVEDFDKIEPLGVTLDDACGEAFDKVAKIFGLGYPGGPLIEQLAKRGNAQKILFRCSGTQKPMDFSFSGIKTAVFYYARDHVAGLESQVSGHKTRDTRLAARDKKIIADIAASFQETVINTLINKSFLACKIKRSKTLVIGGGVVANNRLREKFYEEAREKGLKVYFPSKQLCMDNAAMVAGLGYRLLQKGYVSDLGSSVELN